MATSMQSTTSLASIGEGNFGGDHVNDVIDGSKRSLGASNSSSPPPLFISPCTSSVDLNSEDSEDQPIPLRRTSRAASRASLFSSAGRDKMPLLPPLPPPASSSSAGARQHKKRLSPPQPKRAPQASAKSPPPPSSPVIITLHFLTSLPLPSSIITNSGRKIKSTEKKAIATERERVMPMDLQAAAAASKGRSTCGTVSDDGDDEAKADTKSSSANDESSEGGVAETVSYGGSSEGVMEGAGGGRKRRRRGGGLVASSSASDEDTDAEDDDGGSGKQPSMSAEAKDSNNQREPVQSSKMAPPSPPPRAAGRAVGTASIAEATRPLPSPLPPANCNPKQQKSLPATGAHQPPSKRLLAGGGAAAMVRPLTTRRFIFQSSAPPDEEGIQQMDVLLPQREEKERQREEEGPLEKSDYGIQKIIDMKVRQDQPKRAFLCRWYGHSKGFASWEPEEFLPQKLVKTYLEATQRIVVKARKKQADMAAEDERKRIFAANASMAAPALLPIRPVASSK